MVELTYSPNEEAYELEEELNAPQNMMNYPRMWFLTRGGQTGIGQPLDLHYWNAQIARFDQPATFHQHNKEALKNFGEAINSLLEENRRKNALIAQGGVSAIKHRIIFYLFNG